MLIALLGLTSPALALDDVTLTWQLSVGEDNIGERTLTIKTLTDDHGERRVLEGFTTVDAAVAGIQLSYQQRLTAVVAWGPASFTAVLDHGGEPREVQGRRSGGKWLVSVTDKGRSRSWNMPSNQIDLSTVDLFDPSSKTGFSRMKSARVLSAETGAVLEGPIEPLGPSDIAVDGKDVSVDGYAWTADGKTHNFYYTSDGYLVRYETRIMGHKVRATLVEAPPPDADELPVDIGGDGVEAVQL